MMDKMSRHLFERLVQLDATALTEADREFLKARKSYMNDAQRIKFTTFLDEVSQGDPVVRPGSVAADYNDIVGAMEADAELRASTGTLSEDHQRVLDHATATEKSRQAVVTAAVEAQEIADKEVADAEKARSANEVSNVQTDYDDMSKTELKDLADKRGVEVSSTASKAELVKALEKNDKK